MTVNRRKRPIELQDSPEHRAIPIERVEFRDDQGDENILHLEGYASTFEPYEMYGGPASGGWIERLDKAAFDKTLREKPDLHLLINHAGLPLARTKSGNLQLSADGHGLKVRAQLDRRDPDVQSLAVKMARGDMDEMSFAFRVKGQKWDSTPEFKDDPEAMRTITEVSLHKGDVSVVNWGANPTTHAEVLSAPDLLRKFIECEDFAEVRSDDDLVKRAMAKLGGHVVEGIAGPTGTILDGSAVNAAARSIDYVGQTAGSMVAGLLEALADRADAGTNAIVASLDAVIDQACSLTCDVDRESLDPAVGQALDLIAGADSIVDQLMEALGICDPDDMDDERADSDEPYGDVPYADDGMQPDGKKRYPIDSAAHVKSAWAYINKSENADKYTAEQLSEIKDKIKAAAKKFGVDIESDEKSELPVVEIHCEGFDRPAFMMVLDPDKRSDDGKYVINWDKDLVAGSRSLLSKIESTYDKPKVLSLRLARALEED